MRLNLELEKEEILFSFMLAIFGEKQEAVDRLNQAIRTKVSKQELIKHFVAKLKELHD